MTLPGSGMMRSGKLFRPTGLASLISEKGSSLLPTPSASAAVFSALKVSSMCAQFNSDSTVQLYALLAALGIPRDLWPRAYENVMGFPLDWTLLDGGSE